MKNDERYQNIGAPFRGADGKMIRRGMVFVPTELDLSLRHKKLRPLNAVVRGEPMPIAPVEAFAPTPPALAFIGGAVSPAPAEPQQWTMIMSPQKYLQLHPMGQHAALARRILREQE